MINHKKAVTFISTISIVFETLIKKRDPKKSPSIYETRKHYW